MYTSIKKKSYQIYPKTKSKPIVFLRYVRASCLIARIHDVNVLIFSLLSFHAWCNLTRTLVTMYMYIYTYVYNIYTRAYMRI